MDNHQLDAIRLMQSSNDIEELWANLNDGLAQLGITSIFYGFVYSGTFLKKAYGIESGWFKTNHPSEYLKYFGREFNMEDDPTSIHCINETTPFVWHDTRQWEGITKRQLTFMQKSAEFGMGVGVTLPFHFNNNGVGGMGLCMANIAANDFDSLWNSKGNEISSIARSFDELVHNKHIRSIFNLLENELKALTSLSLGQSPKAIAYDMQISLRQINNIIKSAINKLNSKTREQAVSKALVFGLITI